MSYLPSDPPSDPTSDPTGDPDGAADLTALMTRTVSDLQPPVDRLQQGAVVRGRRIRRRRQGAALLGGVAAATALAVLVAPGVGGSAADRNGFVGDPSGAGSVEPTPVSTTATAQPETRALPHGFWDMPSDTMRDRLAQVLPPDVHVTRTELAPPDRAPGEPAVSQGWLLVDFTRDGMTGEGSLEIQLWGPGAHDSFVVEVDAGSSSGPGTSTGSATTATSADVSTCPDNLDLVPPSTCTELLDQHGAHVGSSAALIEGNLVQHLVTVKSGQGYVYAGTANTTDAKWGPGSAVSAPEPLLTLEEVRAIAQAGSWTAWTPPTP